jgi:hypothetical protein
MPHFHAVVLAGARSAPPPPITGWEGNDFDITHLQPFEDAESAWTQAYRLLTSTGNDEARSARLAAGDPAARCDEIDARYADAEKLAWSRTADGYFDRFMEFGTKTWRSSPGSVSVPAGNGMEAFTYAVVECRVPMMCLTCGFETDDYGDAAEEAHSHHDGAHEVSLAAGHNG